MAEIVLEVTAASVENPSAPGGPRLGRGSTLTIDPDRFSRHAALMDRLLKTELWRIAPPAVLEQAPQDQPQAVETMPIRHRQALESLKDRGFGSPPPDAQPA